MPCLKKSRTLETRKWDDYDFKEVAVWSVEAALKAAYDAGSREAERKAQKDKSK
ncbi:DUF6900 domain-containing protein [Neisseria chenwenguii]|uniref:DUF6900 domain-containing protein n=1 Tax=Neisseria chenwenguii TaxID=1853278 RepID=UPI003988EAEB